MNNFDPYFDPHAYWDRERQEGPTDWGHADDGSVPPDPTDAEWAELQAEVDLQRQNEAAALPAPEGGDPEP